MEEQVNRLVQKTWGAAPRPSIPSPCLCVAGHLADQTNPAVGCFFVTDRLQQLNASARLLIAISGIPGSGKTKLAGAVARGVNERYHAASALKYPNSAAGGGPWRPDVARVVPLDGFHLTRAQLQALPDADEAVFRRGAAFTFDAAKFVAVVRRVRAPIGPETTTIYAPSFDHAVKDPVDDDVAIPRTARVVIFEGLYAALDRAPWRDAAQLMDELWFVHVAVDVATERLVNRHVASGISPTAEHARVRVLASDMRNGREILAERLEVHELVQSVEDDGWKPEPVTAAEQSDEAHPHRLERLDSLAELAHNVGGI